MITRRHALQLAAAAAAGAAAPLAVTPEQAAALLDGPAEFDPGPGRGTVWSADFGDPSRFADAVDGVDFVNDLFEHGAAEEVAAYHQALDALFRELPILRSVPSDHPIHRLDEAALAMWSVAWMAGVRAGAAYEHLRLALVTPRQTCRRCHGHGRLWGGEPYRAADDGDNAETCAACDGAGTVPTPAPTVALATDGTPPGG